MGKTQITLNLKSLSAAVAELDEYKSKITAHAGTQATRLAAARAAVIDDVIVNVPSLPTATDFESIVTYADVLKKNADQALDEAITAHLTASKDESASSLTALREAFKTKAEAATALKQVLVTVGVEGADAVAIPTLKGTGRIGTGSSKSANTKGQAFYRIVNGVRKDQPASQNKYSSMAFYFGAAIVGTPGKGSSNNGAGVTSDELTKFLTGKGVEITAGSPWSFKVSDDFVVGMDVEPPTSIDDVPAADDSDDDDE